jgi:hypothetical protein
VFVLSRQGARERGVSSTVPSSLDESDATHLSNRPPAPNLPDGGEGIPPRDPELLIHCCWAWDPVAESVVAGDC